MRPVSEVREDKKIKKNIYLVAIFKVYGKINQLINQPINRLENMNTRAHMVLFLFALLHWHSMQSSYKS